MSLVEILSSIVQLAVVTGIAFVVIVAITSYMRFHQMAHEASQATPEDEDAEGAFQIQIAERLGTGHKDQDAFAVVIMGVVGIQALRDEHGPEGYAEIRRFIMEQLRSFVRKDDQALWIGEDRLGLLVKAPVARIGPICERVLEQIAEQPGRLTSGTPVRPQVAVGISTFPAQGERVGALYGAALDAVHQSLAEGPGAITFAGGPPDAVEQVQPTVDDPLASVSAEQRELVNPLTGFLLEKHLGSMLQKRVAQSRRDELPVSIVSLQIDHLDRYQDHYGTAGVETILRSIGSYLQVAVRETDMLAHYGEEPLVLIMGCHPGKALAAAQRLADGIRKREIIFGHAELKITISGGVAGFPDHGGIPKKLLEYSITALETAKAKGRNQVLFYETGMALPRVAGAPADSF